MSAPDPNRFQVSPLVLLIDKVMNRIISFGGISLIVFVFGIFLFIAVKIYPLFLSAKVTEVASTQSSQIPPAPADAIALAVDEYGEKPLVVTGAGSVHSLDSSKPAWEKADLGLPEDFSISSVSFRSDRLEGIWGGKDGRAALFKASYHTENLPDQKRLTTLEVKASAPVEVGLPGLPVLQATVGHADSEKLIATLQIKDGKPILKAALVLEKRGLGGRVRVSLDESWEFPLSTTPSRLIALAGAKHLLAVNPDGTVLYFTRIGGPLEQVQTFRPFGDLPSPEITQAFPLFGDVSLVCANAAGANRIFSLYEQPDPSGAKAPNGKPLMRRLWGATKELPAMPGAATSGAVSTRNKCFLVASQAHVSLRHSTSETVRWETDLSFTPLLSAITPKYDGLLFLDIKGALHRFTVHDPHPETGFKAYFGKVWYEGRSEPAYIWQSTGGSDEFEPKLSLVPIIFGTLKGTFYAMIFSVPIALLSAIYVSQFASVRTRLIVKPIIEVMASLPSVVLGFLAALILALLLEKKVPSLILALAAIPITALVMALVANSLPTNVRNWMRQGREWWLILPTLVGASIVAWQLGPWLETVSFGGDFRTWWASNVGDFQQRNSLVVAFAIGFAVIPIIFTIAEDSLSNVPGTLRSASLALGASRWQTALRVVVPTASPGIFSAVMIGLGRAVGETMIVVMATGNTPIMDVNLFNGMRTLAANIAVELPEAAENGTLFRSLYVCAFLLFLMTFCVNTIAEVMRQRLREKYKTV